MIRLIKKYILAGSEKNENAPYVFVVLCVYAIITSIYTLLFFSFHAMVVRFLLSIFIVAIYVVTERSRLSVLFTAFLSPTLISFVVIVGSLYFRGDFLIFTYQTGAAMIVLTYLKPKALKYYIAVIAVVSSVIIFAFQVNLLGPAFTMVYNYLYFIVSVAINILVYIFNKAYVITLDELTEAKNEATVAAQAKGSFLANMSHEIRTPLNAIIGLTQAELRKDLPGEENENLQKIYASGNLLLGIINDILDLSKIESGKFELINEEYCFADMIHETVSLNMVRIESKPIELSVTVEPDIPSRMIGDELRIKQILNNLLSNAIKFTKKGSINLDIKSRWEDSDIRLFFTVKDSGMGIKGDDLAKLFDEYSQINSISTRGIEGTGLGLTICKGLSESMGGKIYAESVYGSGSSFMFDILQQATGSEPIGKNITDALNNFTYHHEYDDNNVVYTPMPFAKVLVVDDLDINLDVASACLEPYEIQVDCIDNGAGAVQRIKEAEQVYDLILMDHMMPGMDGIEATKLIRELGTPYSMGIPIIALTANAIMGNDKMFTDNGFQGFLAKPIDLDKLDECLQKWIKKPVA